MKAVSTDTVVADLFWTQYLSIILIIIVTIVAALFGKGATSVKIQHDQKVASVPLGLIYHNGTFSPSQLEGSVEALTSHDIKGVFYIGSSDVTTGVAQSRILTEYLVSRGVPRGALSVFFSLEQKDGSASVVFERQGDT